VLGTINAVGKVAELPDGHSMNVGRRAGNRSKG
jgi:hypothetical protein